MRSSTSRAVVACVVGGGYGMVISMLVNIALVAIAKNKIFATYFGILFSLLGSGFLWRICKSPVTVTGGSSIHRPLLITFAILVLIAGKNQQPSAVLLTYFLLSRNRRLLLHRRRQHLSTLPRPQNTHFRAPRRHRLLRAYLYLLGCNQRLRWPLLPRTDGAKVTFSAAKLPPNDAYDV